VKEHANYHEYIRCIFSLNIFKKTLNYTNSMVFFFLHLFKTYPVLKFVNFLPDSSEKFSATPD